MGCYSQELRVALIGYGNVGKAFARLLFAKRGAYPFRIVGVHTKRHGTAYDTKGIGLQFSFGPPASSAAEFLDRSKPDVAIEITTLNPHTGEPAISHIQAAFERHLHVITANKGPIAYAYAGLRAEAQIAQVEFRFESTVMDGAPVFNTVRNNLPGVTIEGFTGVLNSTSKIVVGAMERGLSMAEGIREAQSLGVAEADAAYDIDGWDSAAKTAALANVLMDACVTPQGVQRHGIGQLTTDEAITAAKAGYTTLLVSRGERSGGTVRLQVKPEVVPQADILATAKGTSNLLLFHTDLMGTIGTVSINPGVEQTAYGLFSDLVDVAKSV
ncbi:MAG: homoserine dehydrogenase [Acidobacteriaceae bacterium]|nr:homoserine dehydrogenase [Acidobacteriaceae bacterium]